MNPGELLEKFKKKQQRLQKLLEQGAAPKEFYHEYYEQGQIITHTDGRSYQVTENGNWVRIRKENKT